MHILDKGYADFKGQINSRSVNFYVRKDRNLKLNAFCCKQKYCCYARSIQALIRAGFMCSATDKGTFLYLWFSSCRRFGLR